MAVAKKLAHTKGNKITAIVANVITANGIVAQGIVAQGIVGSDGFVILIGYENRN